MRGDVVVGQVLDVLELVEIELPLLQRRVGLAVVAEVDDLYGHAELLLGQRRVGLPVRLGGVGDADAYRRRRTLGPAAGERQHQGDHQGGDHDQRGRGDPHDAASAGAARGQLRLVRSRLGGRVRGRWLSHDKYLQWCFRERQFWERAGVIAAGVSAPGRAGSAIDHGIAEGRGGTAAPRGRGVPQRLWCRDKVSNTGSWRPGRGRPLVDSSTGQNACCTR